MTIKTLLIAGIAITSAIPASAQELPTPAIIEAPASHSDGIRIAETSNGFQLVEHGLWRSVQDGPAPVVTVPRTGLVNLPYRYERNPNLAHPASGEQATFPISMRQKRSIHYPLACSMRSFGRNLATTLWPLVRRVPRALGS